MIEYHILWWGMNNKIKQKTRIERNQKKKRWFNWAIKCKYFTYILYNMLALCNIHTHTHTHTIRKCECATSVQCLYNAAWQTQCNPNRKHFKGMPELFVNNNNNNKSESQNYRNIKMRIYIHTYEYICIVFATYDIEAIWKCSIIIIIVNIVMIFVANDYYY